MNARPWRWLPVAVGGAVIALAVVLGILRLALSRAPEHADDVAAWIQAETGLRLSFARLDARLRWFGPEVVLHDALVLDRSDGSPLFTTREGSIGLDLLELFRSGRLVAGRIAFVEPELAIERLADGRFRLVGLRERRPDAPPFDLERLPNGRLDVYGARVEYRDLTQPGQRSWRLENVNLQLRRDSRALAATGRAELPEALGRSLEFELQLEGPLGDPGALGGRVDARLSGVRLTGLAEFEPRLAERLLDGSGELRAVATLASGRLARGRVELDLRDLQVGLPERATPTVRAVEISAPRVAVDGNALAMPVVEQRFVEQAGEPLPARLEFAALRGTVRYRHEQATHHLSLEGLELVRRGLRTAGPPLNLEVDLRGNLRSTFELHARSSPLQLEQYWPLAYALPVPALEPWLGLAPQGSVNELELGVRRARAGAPPRFGGRVRIEGLGWHAVGRQPGLAGLSLRADGDDDRGRFDLRVAEGRFELPRLFRVPLTVHSAAASGTWRREGRGWRIASEDVVVEDPRAAARGRIGFYLEPGTQSPVLEAHATVTHADASAVREVLPIGRMKPTTIAWFELANLRGRAVSGTFEYRGPVRRFPFRNGEGEFLARAEVRDGALDYFPGFAPLSAASATVEFRNASLRVRSNAVQLAGLAVQNAEYYVADYKAPVIEVRGQASGDLEDALGYLQRSPLGPRLGAQFMALEASGSGRYRVSLTLPTTRPDERRYRVGVEMRAASVRSPLLRAPLERVDGTLQIYDDTAHGNQIRASYLGGPVTVGVQPGTPAADADRAVLVSARGRVDGAQALPLLGLPRGIEARGNAAYALEARIERERTTRDWRAQIEAESGLDGIEIDAPVPFAKRSGERRATRVEARTRGADRTELRIESGQGRAALAFQQRSDGAWRLERGQARFDAGSVQLPEQPGVALVGSWPDVDLAEWIALGAASGARADTAAGRGLADWLGPLDVEVERLRLLGFEFRQVDARAEAGRDGWRIDVSGPDAVGRVHVPFALDGPQPLIANLERVTLRRAPPVSTGDDPAPQSPGDDADPRRAPAVLLHADDLAWEQRRFGKVDAELRRVPAGLELVRLHADSANAFTLEGSGSWLAQPAGGSETRLALELRSEDFAATCRALGYRDAVEAKAARLAAQLRWPGAPDGKLLARMAGTVSLELDRGRVRSIEPGAGRMLGLLSVVELPRRLALDFRDVTDEGLAFDTVRGDFSLREGSAYTENLLLKGPALSVGLAGRTGLVAEDYDQVLVVSGNTSGPLAVAGALAGGPVIGAGVLVLSQLFKGQLEGLARVYYRVGGSWTAPVVERITAPQAPEDSAASATPEGPG